MVYKIDLYHRDKAITFGPRFKGEVGKDIFAVKVALGLLTPISESDQDTISYDAEIPFDQQRWFDCSSGVGVDIKKATKFDTTLENALLTYQINNKFLITAYYFEKFGIKNLLEKTIKDNGETIYAAEIVTQMNASMTLFESELRTLGEATIAVMHGWRPASTIKNNSYTHDPEIYAQRVDDVIPRGFFEEIIDPLYPQNLSTLEEQEIVIPDSASPDLIEGTFSSTRNWWNRLTDPSLSTASISYYPVHSGNSPLFVATTKIIDYYLENNLFSQTLSQEELTRQARRALYPDPFSSTETFIIDGTTLGLYMETDFFLRAEGPLPNEELETIALLEEKALIKALSDSGKPQVWNFLKDEQSFRGVYFSFQDPEFKPDHSGIYPINITTEMLEQIVETYPDQNVDPRSNQFLGFKVDNYWVLSTSDITGNLEEGDRSIQYWRVLENIGGTEPLIKFKEFITPSLRPGESYRALFEINRQKFDLITNGDNLFVSEEEQQEETFNDQPTDQNACLNQSADQTLRTYEEYRAHAIKKRRDLVRKIREEIQRKSRNSSTIDLGVFDSSFSGLNIDSYTDYQLVQSLAQLLPGQELAEIIASAGGGAVSDSLTWLENNVAEASGKTANPDGDNYTAAFSYEEFKERIEKASKDLRESAEVIRRERIRLTPESQFDGNSEASFLSSIPAEIESAYSDAKNKEKLSDKFQIIFTFKESEYTGAGFKNGKVLLSVVIQNNGDSTTIFGDQKKQPDALKRPRTVNYISQLKDMTFFPKLSSFFDDSRNSCKDLGINLDKITGYAYITKYTSGLSVIVDPGEEGFSFKSWWEQEVEDPIIRFGQQSRDNLKASWDSSNFDEDAALRALGADCTAEKIWGEIFDRLDPVSLICDYIKCLKLPPFDLKFPDFNIDPVPKIGIIGWYKGLIEFLINNMRQIIERLGCTIGRMIIDKLAFPFCEEQLNDFITSGLESTQPFVKQALIDSLIRTGVTDNNKAKTFFDSASNILTGRELCYILDGNMPDNATMAALQRLAESSGVDPELTPPEEIINFFGVIGVYMPEESCEQLNNRTIIQPTQCDSTNDLLRSIRNRLQSSDSSLSESEINNALALAEKNKQEEADRVKSFLENGFSGLVPPVFDYGNPSAPMSDFPEFLKKEQEKSAQNLFSNAKASYSQGLQEYVPAMYITIPMNLWPYDERYDQVQVLRIEAALQQIKNYSKAAQREVETGQAPSLLNHYSKLFELYQTEIVEDLPQDLIPEDFRPDLNVKVGTGTTQSPRYLVPHVTTFSMGVADGSSPGVLVHKRMIAREGETTEQDIIDEIESLNVVIRRYNKRVERTRGGKRDRLRGERRPFIRRKNRLAKKLEEGAPFDDPEIVEYEFFMAYQKNINREEFQALGLEFDLVPHSPSIFSTSLEHSNHIPEAMAALIGLELGGAFYQTEMAELARRDFGTADDNPRATSQIIGAIKDRILELNDRISEILQNRPQITDDSLFPGLQEMLDQQTESALEKISRETVATVGSAFEIKFKAGAIYSPSITLNSRPEFGNKDRFDIIVKGDFFTGLGQDGTRTFKYCNTLPDIYKDPELPPLEQANSFAKRFRFRNAVADSLREIDFEFEFRSRFTQFLQATFFKSTTESLIETLLDELGESYLFDAYQVEMLDNRISGKRQINNSCVSNRFSLGDGSVAAFNKVIMGDVASEIAKEMIKPENSPENYDFDTIPAFDLAMQNICLKGYVRICLMDMLLKGGLAYSVWDIEPVIGEKFFIDYAISHVKTELESSDELKEPWGRIIERVTGISNKNAALEILVKEELIKIPNYSKQIFHPQNQKSNFYNWFLENHMSQFNMASRGDIENNKPLIAARPVPDQEEVFFLEGKQKFIIEHYIRISGPNLVREFKQSLENISGIQGEEIQTGEYFLNLSIGDFVSAKSRLENPSVVRNLLSNTSETILQASRVVLVDPTRNTVRIDGTGERNKFVEKILEGEDNEATLSEKSVENKSYWVVVQYSKEDSTDKAGAFAIPFFSTTRVLDFEDCYSFDDYSKDEFNESLKFMVDKLSKEKQFEMMFDHIFPIRRLMSLCSVFATSIVSGYNSMPTIMTPAKVAIASITKTMGMSRNARAELVTISQEEFLKQLTENFPTSEDACLDWPPGIGDFYNKFFEELMKLIRKMPSIILRGIANQLDPAYKEMRQHYLNCDIKHLTYRGLKPAGTGLYKLTNGLYLDGRTPLLPREDVGALQGSNRGKYVPLVTGVLSDMGVAFGSLPSFSEFGLRLGLMITKLVSYIYSGNKPFLDPSFYFKFPCMDIDEGAWRDYGKYDAGLYGRYGHPLSPFTLLALSTPQLESDKRIKENNCIEEEKLEGPDCVPGEPVILMPEKQRDDAGAVLPTDPYEGLLPPGASPPSQEVLQRQQEAIDAERAELVEYSDWYNSMTPEQQQELLRVEIAQGEDPSALTTEANCDAPRKAIRIAINRLREVKFEMLQNPNNPFIQSLRNEERELSEEILNLKIGLVLAGCRGAPADGNAYKTKDVVTARFFREGETTPFYSKQVEIPWRSIYQNNQIDGFFDFTNSTDYDNFGK